MSNEPDRERIALWVAALRDPEAKQARKVLTRADGGGDCCLGIACKVAIANGLQLETGIGAMMIEDYATDVVVYGFPHGEKAFLPTEVQEWFGFDSHNPCIGYHDEGQVTGTLANDIFGLTLPEIADIIEAHFLAPAAEPVAG